MSLTTRSPAHATTVPGQLAQPPNTIFLLEKQQKERGKRGGSNMPMHTLRKTPSCSLLSPVPLLLCSHDLSLVRPIFSLMVFQGAA